jgi:hypothetical protein
MPPKSLIQVQKEKPKRQVRPPTSAGKAGLQQKRAAEKKANLKTKIVTANIKKLPPELQEMVLGHVANNAKQPGPSAKIGKILDDFDRRSLARFGDKLPLALKKRVEEDLKGRVNYRAENDKHPHGPAPKAMEKRGRLHLAHDVTK